jgi:hypothetical protein
MSKSKNWRKIVGLTLHLLLGVLMIVAGVTKILWLIPAAPVERLGLSEHIQLIGAGELITAILLLIPRTLSLGILLTSSYWGGAICIHMAHADPYVLQSVLLVLAWVGAYLRNPATLYSFAGPPGMARQVMDESEATLA